MIQQPVITANRLKTRQRKALLLTEQTLKAELPNALGMSASATSFYLMDDAGPAQARSGGISQDRTPLTSAGAGTYSVRRSEFHLAMTYQHQLCGECYG